MDESLGIIKLIQEQIANDLNEAKSYLNAQLEFSDGSSHAFSKFIANFSYQIKPFLEQASKCMINLSKLNAQLASEKNSYMNKTNLILSAYDSLFQYTNDLKSKYMILFRAISLALNMIVESQRYVNNFYNEYKNAYLKYYDIAKENERLKMEYHRYENTQEYLKNAFLVNFNNEKCIKNSEKAFNIIKDQLIEKIKEIEMEKKNQFDELSKKLNSSDEEHQKEISKLQEEINELKKVNAHLSIQNKECETEKEALELKLAEKDEELRHFAAVVTKNEELESAISDLCEKVPDIAFEGGHFEVTTDSVQIDSITKMSLERARKDKMRLETDLENLRHSSSKEYQKLEQRLTDENRALKKALNESYAKLRIYGVEKSEMATKISELNAELENEKARAIDSEETLKRFRREATEAKARQEVITAGLDQRIKALAALKPSTYKQKPTVIPIPTATADEALKESNDILRKELESVKKKLMRAERSLKELSSSTQFSTQSQSECKQADSSEEREAILRRALEAEAREKRLRRRLEEEREVSAREKNELELTIAALRQTKEVEEPHPPPQPAEEPDMEIAEATESFEPTTTEDADAAVE